MGLLNPQTYTSSQLPGSDEVPVDLVIVGGGGAGGYSTQPFTSPPAAPVAGGGGGGGEVISAFGVTVKQGVSYTVSVGAGASVGGASTPSYFGSIEARGGASAFTNVTQTSHQNPIPYFRGGTGAGNTYDRITLNSGTLVSNDILQSVGAKSASLNSINAAGTFIRSGFIGGTSRGAVTPQPGPGAWWTGAPGGGGAGGSGLNATPAGGFAYGGNGGAAIFTTILASGLPAPITGSNYFGASYFGGGGGGAGYQGGSAGDGGGRGVDLSPLPGPGVVGSGGDGQTNRGGGGGGGYQTVPSAGQGGSGAVIISYPDTYRAPVSITGTYVNASRTGFRVYLFTGTGTITF